MDEGLVAPAPAVDDGGRHVLRRERRQAGDAMKHVNVFGIGITPVFCGFLVDGWVVEEECDAAGGVGEVVEGGDVEGGGCGGGGVVEEVKDEGLGFGGEGLEGAEEVV